MTNVIYLSLKNHNLYIFSNIILPSYKNIIGTATSICVNISTEGVIIPAITKDTRIAYLRYFESFSELTRPILPSKSATRGSSNTTPQETITDRAKEK